MRLLIGLVLAAIASGAQAQTAEQWAWFNALEKKDWEFATSADDDDTAVFFRKPQRTANAVRMWSRYEFRKVTKPKSYVEFVEYDCSGGRTRSLQQNRYSGTNLTGESSQSGIDQWDYVVPGSVGEKLLERACQP